jgi:hypothetical protein
MPGREQTLDTWGRMVGRNRAQAAWDALGELAPLPGGQMRTLPEVLAEMWLRARGVQYEAQVELQWARPDMVLTTMDGAGQRVKMIWRIQGQHWHTGEQEGKDTVQKTQLKAARFGGVAVTKVVDLWEQDIYQGDYVFDQALLGHELRPRF